MEYPAGLAKLREPFPQNQISKLPKESRAQIDERKANRASGVNCKICGSWHHRNAVHLDYVGHAALTDRLLDCDPAWSWEPLTMSPEGLPTFDGFGGMWIRLTVCGVTRLGYGHAGEKNGGDAIKEVIGDALRNAAMRFGAALELWHKGDLHKEPADPEGRDVAATDGAKTRQHVLEDLALDMIEAHKAGKDLDAIAAWYDAKTWDANQETANEERLFVWGLLKAESKLRSAIKANKPDHDSGWKEAA